MQSTELVHSSLTVLKCFKHKLIIDLFKRCLIVFLGSLGSACCKRSWIKYSQGDRTGAS